MGRLELGKPILLGNMLLVPVLGDDGCVEVLTVEEGISRGAQVKETGDINSVIVENPLEEEIFIMDGEELIGARQDRISAVSAVIEPKRSERLEVFCVEKGRWEGEAPFSSGFTAFPRLRMTLSFSRDRKSLQETVWNLIDTKLRTLKVSSTTMSLHHSFVEREKELSMYTCWEPPEDTVGIMAFSNRGFLCCDVFGTRGLFSKLRDKVVKGYALDALEDRIRGRSFSIDMHSVSKVWREIERALDRIGKEEGRENRLSTSKIRGKFLKHRGSVLHATFFPSR